MFRRTRERIERIERALEKLLERSEAPAAAAPAASGGAEVFAKLLGSTLQSQADLVGSFGDIAVRSVARRNGIRGGTSNARTAQRDRDGKFLPKENRRRRAAPSREPACPLCAYGESYATPTIPMIQEHRRHLEQRQSRHVEEDADGQPEHWDKPDSSDEGQSAGAYRNGSGNAGPDA